MWIRIITQSQEPIELDCIDVIQFESTDPYWDKLQVTNFGFLTKDETSLHIDNMQIPTNDILNIYNIFYRESLLKDADEAVERLIASLFPEDYSIEDDESDNESDYPY